MKKKWLIVATMLVLAIFAMAFAACNLLPGNSGSDDGGEKGGSDGDLQMKESYTEARARLEALTDVLIPALADADAEFEQLDGGGAEVYTVTIRGQVSFDDFNSFVRYFDGELASFQRSDGGENAPYPMMMYRGDNATVGVAWNDGEKALIISVMLGSSGSNQNKDHEHAGEWVVDREATCTVRGERHRVCTICGQTETEYYGGEGHQGEWSIVKAATCTDDGEKARTCTVCGEVEKDKIDATGHKLGDEWHTMKSVTCGVGDKYVVCETCGAHVHEANAADLTRNHQFDSNGVCRTCGEHRATEGLLYDATGDTVVVTGYEGSDTEVFIPSYYDGKRVTEIGENAFKDSGVTEVTLATGITKIGNAAFYGCNVLTKITIPTTIREVGVAALFNCFKLAELRYDGSYADYFAIKNLEGLTDTWSNDQTLYFKGEAVTGTVAIPEGVSVIPDGAFTWCHGILAVTMPESGVKSIGKKAFARCYTIATLTLSDTIEYIGEDAFFYCRELTTVELPAALKVLGDGAFDECTKLTSVHLGNAVTSIGNKAFYECIALKTINIPYGVVEIGRYAFYDCSALERLAIPATVTKIGDQAFLACGCNLQSLTVDEENPVYRSQGNCLIEKATQTVILGCNDSVIPRGILTIGDSAFLSCSKMTAITLPDSLTTIEERAFRNAFKLTSITIPSEVKEIKASAFSSCRELTAVTLPKGIESIGSFAFDCYKLKDIYYAGSQADWAEVNKDYNWDYGTSAYTIHCSDGDLVKE